MRKIHHHIYILPGITDVAKQRADAERDRDKNQETSIVHDHPHFDVQDNEPRRTICTEKCMIYIPGEPTRSVTLSEARI